MTEKQRLAAAKKEKDKLAKKELEKKKGATKSEVIKENLFTQKGTSNGHSKRIMGTFINNLAVDDM